MSDFATDSDVISALAACVAAGFNQDMAKTTITTVSGFEYSGWTQAGFPAAGVAPTAWAHPTYGTTGAINPKMINGDSAGTRRVLYAALAYSIANQVVCVRDRVGHMGGLSGTSVAAQSVNATLTAAAADGRCAADGSDVEWFLEWYTATGSTGINVTVNVTYNDDTTGNVVVAIPASVPANRMYRITPSSGNRTIKQVNTVTNSATTGTAGNYGVTATNRVFMFMTPVANTLFLGDWASLGFPQIGKNACLYFTVTAVGTAFGTITGTIKAGVK